MEINITPEAIQGPPPVPAGMYKATLTGQEAGTSKNGNPQIVWDFTISSQGPDESVNTVGRKVRTWLTITEKAIGVVNSSYKGVTGQDLPLGSMTVDELMGRITSDCANRECMVQVIVEPNRNNPDQMVNSIKKIQPII